MKKALVTIAGILITTASIMPTISKKSSTNLNQEFVTKTWKFEPFTVTAYKDWKKWLYFSIDNINLTSMGIKNINDLHSYTTIEIPGLEIKFNNYLALSGDSWKTNRNIGSEDWYTMFKKDINWTTSITLQSASTIWYDNNSGDLMMRLAYQGSIARVIPPNIHLGGEISYKSGSEVRIC